MQGDAVAVEMDNFLSLATLSEHRSSLLLDGIVISSGSWTAIDRYSVVTVQLSHGWHYVSVVEDSDATFAAYVYGRAKTLADHYAYGYAATGLGSSAVNCNWPKKRNPRNHEFHVKHFEVLFEKAE